MIFTRSTLPIPFTALTFDRYFLYEFRPEAPLTFPYVLCLSSTELQYRYPVNNVSFAPVIEAGPYANYDPFRVPLDPATRGGSVRIPRRMYVAIDAIQTISKQAFLPSHLGRITPGEEREVREKLAAWLGWSATPIGAGRSITASGNQAEPDGE